MISFDFQPPKQLAVPWKDILTSVPFWALTFTHTLNNFGWYMLLVELPMFMSTGLGFKIKEVKVLFQNWDKALCSGTLLC
jgi:hypothetical protein